MQEPRLYHHPYDNINNVCTYSGIQWVTFLLFFFLNHHVNNILGHCNVSWVIRVRSFNWMANRTINKRAEYLQRTFFSHDWTSPIYTYMKISTLQKRKYNSLLDLLVSYIGTRGKIKYMYTIHTVHSFISLITINYVILILTWLQIIYLLIIIKMHCRTCNGKI